MTEIIDPNFLRSELRAKTSSWWHKFGYPFLIISLILLLVFVVYLLFKEYYNPSYNLKNLLTPDYQIALEYDLRKSSITNLQLNDLNHNLIINNLIEDNKKKLDNYLISLPDNLLKEIRKQKHGLIFFPDNEQLAYLVEFNNNLKDLEYPKETNPLYLNTFKNKVLVISNNKELLNKINEQKIASQGILNFSIDLKPWINIYFQKTFFTKEYPANLLSNLQLILNPLLNTKNENFTLDISSLSNKLILNLRPLNLEENNELAGLTDLLNYLNLNNKFSLGINNINILIQQLESNNYLQDIFRNIDNNLWIEYQFSLSEFIQNIKGPIILSFNDNSWQIITYNDNLNLFNDSLKNYLARFNSPLKQEIALPDNTYATELIIDPSSVIWQENIINKWQVFKYDYLNNKKIGYALNENLLIISNNLDSIDFNNLYNDKKVVNCSLNNPNSFVILKPNSTWPISSSKIKEFKEISMFSSNNNQLKMCFELK